MDNINKQSKRGIGNLAKKYLDKHGQKYNWQELQQLRADDEAKQPDHFRDQFAEHKFKKIFDRSGIQPLHQDCTVDNFIADTEEKFKVKRFARSYIDNFSLGCGGFIFSGSFGTGKNHLAAAICNELMKQGASCMIITVNELMQRLRACYDKGSKLTEDEFIKALVKLDLLVIDEIGLQRRSDAETITINQIVDSRTNLKKPTGMITNLDGDDLEKVVGSRVMDRMKMNGGEWLQFEWESFRK